MAETPRCDSRFPEQGDGTPAYECELAAGHEGRHRHFDPAASFAGMDFSWPNHAAPAAPSVGEPEPDTALFGTHIREAMRVIRAPAVEEPRQDTPPDADSAPLSFEDAVRNGRMAETIPALRAELSALRSSLEEARKDSERLDWLLAQSVKGFTRTTEEHESWYFSGSGFPETREDIDYEMRAASPPVLDEP